MNHPNERHDWDGIRAGSTLRWLEGSGPRYAALDFVLVDHVDEDCVILCNLAGAEFYAGPANMSLASWITLQQTPIGHTVNILLRSDAVGIRGLESVPASA